MTDAAERQRRFDGLRQRAAATLNLPIDAERVTVQAAQHLVFEALVSGFIDTGKVPDLSAFVRLSETIVTTTPDPPPAPIDLTIEVVGRSAPPVSSDGAPSPADAGTSSTGGPSDSPSGGKRVGDVTAPAQSAPQPPSLREMARRNREAVSERRYFRPRPKTESELLREKGCVPHIDITRGSEHWLKRNQPEPHPTRGGSTAPKTDANSPAMNSFVGAFSSDGQQLGVRQGTTHEVLNPTGAGDLRTDATLPAIPGKKP